mgnify:CR=1 FL=1
MKVCDGGNIHFHEEIVVDGKDCPLCGALEKIAKQEEEINDSEEEINGLEQEINDLEQQEH